MQYFNTINYQESNDSDTSLEENSITQKSNDSDTSLEENSTTQKSNDSDISLEEHSTTLDLLCDISQFCCLNNMNNYIEFIESKIQKKR